MLGFFSVMDYSFILSYMDWNILHGNIYLKILFKKKSHLLLLAAVTTV